jgi:four helix bundle protein
MLQIREFVIDTIRITAPVAASLARHDRDLASQYRRALSSVALNIAEGFHQRGARRQSHYSIALGSAEEAWSALRTAAAWGYVAEPALEVAARYRQLIGTLYRLAHR